jgi:hypothetical protein
VPGRPACLWVKRIWPPNCAVPFDLVRSDGPPFIARANGPLARMFGGAPAAWTGRSERHGPPKDGRLVARFASQKARRGFCRERLTFGAQLRGSLKSEPTARGSIGQAGLAFRRGCGVFRVPFGTCERGPRGDETRRGYGHSGAVSRSPWSVRSTAGRAFKFRVGWGVIERGTGPTPEAQKSGQKALEAAVGEATEWTAKAIGMALTSRLHIWTRVAGERHLDTDGGWVCGIPHQDTALPVPGRGPGVPPCPGRLLNKRPFVARSVGGGKRSPLKYLSASQSILNTTRATAWRTRATSKTEWS